ncbi:MAG: leucine-rich repeat protein [Muribaculaceae bacterium]|nr:leucine-rich repeat protein [Muribaculaceae bacterium]
MKQFTTSSTNLHNMRARTGLYARCAALSVASFAMLTGCSDTLYDLVPDKPEEGLKFELTADIEQTTDTRADESGFADGDRFGIFVVNYAQDLPGTLTLSDNQANNVAFAYNADANTWGAASDIYWRDTTTPVDVYGYYPFNNGMGDVDEYRFEVEHDQSIAKEGQMGTYEASDLLWAKASRAMPGKKVQLTFNHILAGVKVTLVQGVDFQGGGTAWAELKKTITVDNTVRTASVDLAAGAATPNGTPDRNIVMNPESGDTYRAVTVPQTVAPGKSIIGITIDGVTYHYNRTDGMTYTAGKLHNFTIKIDRKADGSGYALTLLSEDITDWEADKSSHDFESNSYLVVNVPKSGSLGKSLNEVGAEPTTIRNIKITGHICVEDFEYMREKMSQLTCINLSEATVYNYFRYIFDYDNIDDYKNKLPVDAFNSSNSIRRIVLPEELKEIESSSLGRLSLTSTLVIPESVKIIGPWAFYETSGTIELPNNLERIEECAFFNSSASIDLKMTHSLKYIGYRAFSGARNVAGTFQLPTDLEYIGDECFDGCGTGLQGDITIPYKIKEIPNLAFSDMGFSKPIKLTLHDGITKIGNAAFSGLKFSSPITFPKNLTSIASSAFERCDFTGDIILPDGITNLGKYAFGNTNIKGTLELPKSLVSFGGTDDYVWGGLEKGSFSETLIEKLIIGDNIEIINDKASIGCQHLKYVSIGKNVSHIGAEAFSGCPLIETVVCMAKEPPTLDDSAFNNVDYTHCVVEVPEESIELYRNASGWRTFRSITPHHELSFSTSVLNCLNKESTRELTVRADGPWEVVECPSWIHVTPQSADYKSDITIKVDAQPKSGGDRHGEVKFRLKNSGYSNYMTIHQFDYQYEEDNEIVLQLANGRGKPINVFIVGEGYGAEDIANGKYMSRVNETVESLFTIEPYKSYKNMFNVSTTIAVSNDNGAQDIQTFKDTKFDFIFPEIDCVMASVSDITQRMKDYVKNVSSAINDGNIDKALIIMLANYDSFDGSSYQCSNDKCSIAMIGNSTESYPFDNRGLVQKYAGGEAFAGLATEEVYHMETMKGCACPGCNMMKRYYTMKNLGFYENVTISGKFDDSPWKDFIFNPRYSALVDMYEGGCNHLRGIWRSEPESVMNTYIPYYNTISRYAIYKQIMKRAGLMPSLEEFIVNDKIEIPE